MIFSFPLNRSRPLTMSFAVLLTWSWTVFSFAADKPEPPKKIASETFDTIKDAVKNKTVLETKTVGPGDRSIISSPPDGAILIGFDIMLKPKEDVISALRPIFHDNKGTQINGPTIGTPSPRVIKTRAKPGYAVGGVTLRSGSDLNAMIVTYMETQPDRLNVKNSYDTDLLGGPGGIAYQLGGDGAVVIGLTGKHNDHFILGMSLLTVPLPKPAEKKEPAEKAEPAT